MQSSKEIRNKIWSIVVKAAIAIVSLLTGITIS